MKICFINNIFGQEARGGAEKTIKTIAEALIAKNHEITIITGTRKSSTEIIKPGLRLFFVSSKYSLLAKKSWFYRLLFHVFSFLNISGALKINKFLKQEKFDLIWTNNLIGLGLLTFKFLPKTKLIHTFHDIQLLYPSGLMIYQKEKILDSLLAKIYQILTKLIFPKQALVIFPSYWLKNLYAKYNFLPANNLVITNPVNIITGLPKKEHNKFTWLYLGQIEEHKGVELLIKAFIFLAREDSELLIVGSGSLLEKLQTKYQANQQIKFLGQTTPQKVFPLADCLVVPSLCYENLPTVILEAMANNLPVIGSNLGGIEEMIKNENLLFTPTEDDLVRVLSWCLSQKEELKKLAIDASKNFSLITTDEYLKKIGEALKINF